MRFLIKLAGITAVIISFSLFGFLKAFSKKDYIRRLEKTDEALARADNMLRLGVGGRKKILTAAFADVDGVCVTADSTLFSDNTEEAFLRERLNTFFEEFGKGDIPLEQQRIKRVRYEIAEELEKQKKAYASSGKIWRISGVCIGLSIGIMLI